MHDRTSSSLHDHTFDIHIPARFFSKASLDQHAKVPAESYGAAVDLKVGDIVKEVGSLSVPSYGSVEKCMIAIEGAGTTISEESPVNQSATHDPWKCIFTDDLFIGICIRG